MKVPVTIGRGPVDSNGAKRIWVSGARRLRPLFLGTVSSRERGPSQRVVRRLREGEGSSVAKSW